MKAICVPNSVHMVFVKQHIGGFAKEILKLKQKNNHVFQPLAAVFVSLKCTAKCSHHTDTIR